MKRLRNLMLIVLILTVINSKFNRGIVEKETLRQIESDTMLNPWKHNL
jgi:hypothetical protein